ncbi:Inner membrane protein translocase and chaperone YidC, long form, partial [hydrothermal vent metagenome]
SEEKALDLSKEAESVKTGQTEHDEPETAPVADISPVAPATPATPASTDTGETGGEFPGTAETAATASASRENRIRISTGVVDIVLTNKGAVLRHYMLSKYKDASHKSIDLVFNSALVGRKQAELEKEAKQSGADSFERLIVYPTLGLKFPRKEFSRIVNSAYFSADAKERQIDLRPGDDPFTINYELTDKSGIIVKKSYTFYPDKYDFDFSVSVVSSPKWGEFGYSLVWFGLNDEKSDFTSYYSYNGPIVLINGQRKAEAPEDDDPSIEYQGDIKWSALTHRYFTMFAIPEVTKNQTMTSRYIDKSDFTLEWDYKAKVSDSPVNIRFFAGPKKHELLKKYGDGISSIINYGWFDIIAKPLFWLMTFFHGLTGNWGWSVILLTITTKVLFFPLTQKGFKSMQKLQKVQPHLKKIQEAYKDDKEKLNQAMVALYKEHKVNPLGGCLPMILQIPIFFALYKVLLESIELKGAGWILWIDDLAMKDPYYVTPVLMGISMLAQQMMTPSTGDPMQRKMMMLLPVVFTFMFLSFPSGLVIYWLVNNILTIIQQWIIKRESEAN